LHLSKDWKDGSRKKPDLGCKVDEAGQSTEALWWPLRYADFCVASHCRGEEALLSHLYGDEPSGNASSEFPYRCDSPVVSNMTISSLHCCRLHSCWWAARTREIGHVAPVTSSLFGPKFSIGLRSQTPSVYAVPLMRPSFTPTQNNWQNYDFVYFNMVSRVAQSV
jgi:hypothetical protein